MKIKQIRNATIIIEYAGKRFLVDPMLGEKWSFAPFPFSHHQELRNPLHDLPMKAEEIVNNIDCVLLTHLHLDHIDNTAYKLLNKKVYIFVQDEQDRNSVMNHGFTHVEIIGEDFRFGDIRLTKTKSQHGHLCHPCCHEKRSIEVRQGKPHTYSRRWRYYRIVAPRWEEKQA